MLFSTIQGKGWVSPCKGTPCMAILIFEPN
jgi:hypothetical protein